MAICWQESTLWPLLLQKETVDRWFGVFTSAQPPTSECLLAFANFSPVLLRMRTQYPPGPILGLGSRLVMPLISALNNYRLSVIRTEVTKEGGHRWHRFPAK